GEKPPHRQQQPPRAEPPAGPPVTSAQREPPSQPPLAPVPRQPQRTAQSPDLEQRVRELELAKTAQEDAVRSIISDSLSKLGSNINQYVTFGGSLETTASHATDFTGESK